MAKRDETVDPAVRAKANWLRLFNRVQLQLQEVSETDRKAWCSSKVHTGTDTAWEFVALFSDFTVEKQTMRYYTMTSSSKSGDIFVCAVYSDVLS